LNTFQIVHTVFGSLVISTATQTSPAFRWHGPGRGFKKRKTSTRGECPLITHSVGDPRCVFSGTLSRRPSPSPRRTP